MEVLYSYSDRLIANWIVPLARYLAATDAIRDQPIMLIFYLLCYATVLIKFTYWVLCSR